MKINTINLTGAGQGVFQNQQIKSLTSKKYNNSSMSNIAYGNLSLNNSPAAAIGRSMVSFGRAEFEQTVEGNYFKLPEGAKPDEYQLNSANAIYQGHDLLVTAPTGTGKTAIAYYAITKNLNEGKKTFYTAPLKALSDEKFKQLQQFYGEKNVGLLTGDVKINANAPIVVMTTEVYRNMVVGDRFKNKSPQLEGLGTVIFDELHYLGDVDRGGVWEQSIMFSDKNTQLVSLSATIGNNEEINNWMSTIREKQCDLINVPPEKRHVPLVFENIQVQAKSSKSISKGQAKKKGRWKNAIADSPPSEKSYLFMVEKLKKEDKLPAAFFILSKKSSRAVLNRFKQDGLVLNSEAEQAEIQEFVDKYRKDGKYLGESLDVEALKKGYAIHSAGFLPTQKELIEELSQKKLVKVVISTETLSAGINMPLRTVVITSPRKPTELASADGKDGKRNLTPNEFHQMSGRAGRRGIDNIGYAYTMSTSKAQTQAFKTLMVSKPNNINSHFSPSYSFVASYHGHQQGDDLINEILNKSLQAHGKDPLLTKEKTKKLLEVFQNKREVLKKFEFITPENILTSKGELLSKINGYQQIPIIDMIFEKKLSNMNPAELAASVAAMMSADEEVAADKKLYPDEAEAEKVEINNSRLTQFNEDFNGYLKNYNEKMSKNLGFQEIAQDEKVAKHLLTWTDLNMKSGDAIQNWQDFYKTYQSAKIDEGGLFKEITRTSDLLKQISEIAQAGIKIAQSEADMLYYSGLESVAKEAYEYCLKSPSRIFSHF